MYAVQKKFLHVIDVRISSEGMWSMQLKQKSEQNQMKRNETKQKKTLMNAIK